MACHRALLALMLVASAAALAAARPFAEVDNAPGRTLLGAITKCPAGCASCTRATTGVVSCSKCINKLVLLKGALQNPPTGKTGTDYIGTCGCLPGTYWDGTGTTTSTGTATCTDCSAGYYCTGSSLGVAGDATRPSKSGQVSCNATGLTTQFKRSTKATDCVNKPGYYYTPVASSVGTATACPNGTYSAGYLKQQKCDSCPSGFEEKSGTITAQRISSAICVAKAGWYIKSPGVTAPCPKGEYSTGQNIASACTKCGDGITTATTASTAQTACTSLVPGYYAATWGGSNTYIATAKLCNQDSYCRGGAVTYAAGNVGMTACSPTGLLAKAKGAKTAGDCMLPPGFGYDGSTVANCTTSTGYRSGWARVVAGTAVRCVPCGTGVSVTALDSYVKYEDADGAASDVPVAATPASCFIEQGFGMYQTYDTTKNQTTYRAVACTTALNSYGVANTTYGLRANPCKACPDGMELDANNANTTQYKTAAGNWFDPQACVTKAGYGLYGRVATKCPVGTYSAGGNWDDCTDCDFGQTTSGEMSTAVTECVWAAGYGNDTDGQVALCPVGTYHTLGTHSDTIAPCVACDPGYTTNDIGSEAEAECELCAVGYGLVSSACAKCSDGSYDSTNYGQYSAGGTQDSKTPACSSCGGNSVAFMFAYNGSTNDFQPKTISADTASSPADCYLAWAQVVDDQWALTLNGSESTGGLTANGATSLEACATACRASTDVCHFITYDYDAASGAQCFLYTSVLAGNGSASIGYKVAPTADIADTASIKSLPASGRYTTYTSLAQADLLLIGRNKDGDNAPTPTTAVPATCRQNCDEDTDCAAVITSGTNVCYLVYGNTAIAAQNLRSLTRADPLKF